MVRLLATLITVVLFATACGSEGSTANARSEVADPWVTTDVVSDPEADREPIVIPLSLYILVERGDPTSDRSSARTVAEVEAVATNTNEIWSQAGITFDPVAVHRIEAPSEVLIGIAAGDTDPFFATVGRDFQVPDAGLVNGFYVPEAFGVNGFAPLGSRVFFVVDEPTVPDERVTSHEIGHIFGLRHDLVDPGHLMFSGTDGTIIDDEEQTVARYGAAGLLER